MYSPAKIKAVLPYNWEPRPDQMAAWSYLARGGTRLDIVAHRRWGKDDVALHSSCCEAHKRVGTYWHMLPEAAQARKAIWDAINPRTGKRRIDEAFPPFLRKTTRNDEMFIALKCGSTWQVVGSDNYNSLVGSPPIWVTFSEWALAKPEAWSYLRPILRENKGKAIFIWTPRGRNHATTAFEARQKDPVWFTQRIPAAEPVYEGEGDERKIIDFIPLTGVFTEADLFQELKELIDESGSEEEGLAKFNTEYLVDFDAPVPGAFFGKQMRDALNSGRIDVFPYNPAFKVSTAWDIGVDDYTAIWWLQRVSPKQVNAVDYYEASGDGLEEIVAATFAKHQSWKYDFHYMPHDIKVREWGAGRGRKQTAEGLGIRPIRVGMPRDPDDRIVAIRKLLPYIHFNLATTKTGIDHLKQYSRKWNKEMRVYTGILKDGNDHAADALGEFAMNAKLPKEVQTTIQKNPVDRYSRFRVPAPLNWKIM
jgi:hypothetical protein